MIFFGVYLCAVNLFGLAAMGLDKRKAIAGKRRIPENTLMLIACAGGSLGVFIGMYLFRHKTRHLKFVLGIPVIILLQILLFVFIYRSSVEAKSSPTAAVRGELDLIRQLDEPTIHNFTTYDLLIADPDSGYIADETAAQAVQLFFKHFSYQIVNEQIEDNHAQVTVIIKNIDMHALSHDLCYALTAGWIDIHSPKEVCKTDYDQYFRLMRDTLSSNSYPLKETQAVFELSNTDNQWHILTDARLQDDIASGFPSMIRDPYLLDPLEVLTLYMDAFSKMSAEDWAAYLDMDDFFGTNSQNYAHQLDLLYADRIARNFDWAPVPENASRKSEESVCELSIDVTSIDMPAAANLYRKKLTKYGKNADSITDTPEDISDRTAQLLMEAIEETVVPLTSEVTVTMYNDGDAWHPVISEQLTNALLGDLSSALEIME